MDHIVDDQGSLRDFLKEAELMQYFELFRDILKVSKLSQLKFVALEDLAQIGLSKPEQRRYKKIYSKYFPNAYKVMLRKILNVNKKTEPPRHDLGLIPSEYQSITDINVKVPTKHIISIEDITINKELGMGQFGVVQQGTWTTGNQRLQVAIKCLGNERMTSNSTEFLKEAAVMHSIEHPNIVRLYGVVLHLDSLMLVTELAPLRSLLECLREVTLRSNFSVAVLCEFAEQICDGMTYLENKRLIHRDLAARNILVFSKDRVKISDFGLSRALGVGKDYYQTNYNVNLKLPVAWCAPECILYLKFTSSSDVWAFGVCLWEMFTYGFQPWAAFSGQQILEAIDAPNFQRLERPECCPDAYYSLMLECWSHDPNDRPKFKDLGPRLPQLRPDEVEVIANYKKTEDGRRSNFLEYKVGQRITVLGKENYTKSAMWYGVLPGGACGMFDPNHTKLFIRHERGSLAPSLSPHPTRNSTRSIRSSLLRSDVKRHTYTGKRTIQRSMISSPQGEVKHTGHVGLDGAYFGDLSFLDPTGCPPRQIVTPYKPSEDLEQVPLINPNSPSHLTATTSTSPYPLLSSGRQAKAECDEVDLSYGDKSKNSKKPQKPQKPHKSISEPTTSKSLLGKVREKVKSATLGRSHKNEDATSKNDEVHEYHEISDTETDSIAAEMKTDAFPESPALLKGCGDFSQSLLDEIDSIFRNLDNTKRVEEVRTMQSEVEAALRAHNLSQMEKKKGSNSGTMKPMSAHDERTLNTAVALANELTTKSMNDLESDSKPLQSPNERSKFHFKFPLVSSLHHHHHHDSDKDASNKAERRNFSEEAKSVPDIQATITEESKLAYTSLIEQPTPSSSLITQINHDAKNPSKSTHKPSTIPKPAPRSQNIPQQFLSLQKQISFQTRKVATESDDPEIDNVNAIPLPPRGSKPKLVDKPRHIRKYPLRLPNADTHAIISHSIQIEAKPQTIIYQNTVRCSIPTIKINDEIAVDNVPVNNDGAGVDVFDGPENVKVDTNPFTTIPDADAEVPGPSSSNPFKCYLDNETKDSNTDDCEGAVGGQTDFEEEVTLKKDYVSVEDLLEFADQKPSSRQRGVESDEVRIMNKVLKQQVTPEECLDAIEFCDWNIHLAIKLLRIKISVGNAMKVSFEDCRRELENADGDIVKAAAVIVLSNKNVKV
ncbi:activated Cdc42 kinase-like isoform X3 [Vanessa atalanta]|uniref:activated Cdc42 kinase-like isoform X3 n=1 Tax=Vanessa atalanta TaxID=42275 RepID=UPI001FCD6E1C|nr:activated Cdc42 kinase-like isoform X3 [Vanessa atalanta]